MTNTTTQITITSGTYAKGDKQYHSGCRKFYKIDKAKIGQPIVGTVLRTVLVMEAR
jgi:hypothetical protein